MEEMMVVGGIWTVVSIALVAMLKGNKGDEIKAKANIKPPVKAKAPANIKPPVKAKPVAPLAPPVDPFAGMINPTQASAKPPMANQGFDPFA